jgi:hypothetical protein
MQQRTTSISSHLWAHETVYARQRERTRGHFCLIAQLQFMLNRLLVERLGVGGGGRDVGVTGGLVGAGGLLEGLGSSKVSVASGGVLGAVGGEAGVHGRAGKGGEHG